MACIPASCNKAGISRCDDVFDTEMCCVLQKILNGRLVAKRQLVARNRNSGRPSGVFAVKHDDDNGQTKCDILLKVCLNVIGVRGELRWAQFFDVSVGFAVRAGSRGVN